MSETTRAHSSARTTGSSGGSPTAAATACSDRRLRRIRAAPGWATTLRGAGRRPQPARLRGQVPDESARSASRALLDAAVWFAGQGVRIERVLTDNAWAYTSPTFGRALQAIDAGHRRTRPRRPRATARPSASSRRCSPRAPTGGSTAPTRSASGRCPLGSTTTTAAGRTLPSAASPPWRRSSTTSMGITASDPGGVFKTCRSDHEAAGLFPRHVGPRRQPSVGAVCRRPTCVPVATGSASRYTHAAIILCTPWSSSAKEKQHALSLPYRD